MTTYSDTGAFGVPYIGSELFVPDQLVIGGTNTVVTDTGTLHGGAALVRGTVIGQSKFGAVTATLVTGTGAETIGSMSTGVNAKQGAYLVTVSTTSQTSAFTVKNPEGEMLVPGVVGTPYVSNEINFTITAGGTVTAADYFTVTVPETLAPLYIAAIKTAVDGSQDPIGILICDSDPSGGDVVAGIYVAGEFNANALIFDASFTALEIKTLLRKSGMFVKAVTAADNSILA